MIQGVNQNVAKKKERGNGHQWCLMDLHLHTPASSDYQEPDVSYLDILHECENKGLTIAAFTDHNTIAGYRAMREELEQLQMLEKLQRLDNEERKRLDEYRRLLDKILILPGFEFTATLGFHILGVFPPQKSIREIEHLLLSLHVPPDELDAGSVTVGASSDVLTAYQFINEAGGLVIAAHANSSNGVAMRGFGFGGQTKIAYTQDPNLHALEVTDLHVKGRRSTAAFFNGTKPEYPRRMHCIQGSDAHRLRKDPAKPKNLGVGDRPTEVLLSEISFEGLMNLFTRNDFARTRIPRKRTESVPDFVQDARDEGPSIVQDFHESMTVRGGNLYSIIADVCGFANINGGTLFIGVDADPKKPPVGVSNPNPSVEKIQHEISKRISPPIECQVDVQKSGSKSIIRILVPRGDDPPYAVDDNKIYIREEAETGLAVRDEIVQLVNRGIHATRPVLEVQQEPEEISPAPLVISPPRTGVEVVAEEERGGVKYFTMRDLRNGNVVKNVTQSSARRLWHYAISQYTALPPEREKAKITWKGDLGFLRERKSRDRVRYDLAQKTNGDIRFYFGVTEDGIHGDWKELVGTGTD
jgi:hypothetical protein